MRWFVRGDIDGFFGLFIDNLLQLMLIQVLCTKVCGLPDELMYRTILPGAAVSILFGNLFYAWQARRLARRTGRDDVTALPYGINTPSLLAFIFLVMAPVYHRTQDATLAWQAGLFAAMASGVMEAGGAFFGDWLRRHAPRAALLSALAGIAITFIAMSAIFQLFASPEIAVLPMLIILVTYASRRPLPFRIPGGLVSVLSGVALAWGLYALGLTDWQPAETKMPEFHPPTPVHGDLIAVFTSDLGWQFMAVIIPMGLFNILGSLQNLESAEAAGDRFETRPSMLVNGLGTMVGAVFGSPFPTTIYIGHPGWKAMGARTSYSVLNGLLITPLCLFGGVALVLAFVPLEATLGILLWIAIAMTSQAFAAVPGRHALAVSLGLVPAFAAWGLDILVKPALALGKISLVDAVDPLRNEFGVYLEGIIALSQGFMLTSMILAAILVFVIDRRFRAAAAWTAAAAVLSAIGLMHAYDLTDVGIQNRFFLLGTEEGLRLTIAAPAFTVAYALAALGMYAMAKLHPEYELNLDEDTGEDFAADRDDDRNLS